MLSRTSQLLGQKFVGKLSSRHHRTEHSATLRFETLERRTLLTCSTPLNAEAAEFAEPNASAASIVQVVSSTEDIDSVDCDDARLPRSARGPRQALNRRETPLVWGIDDTPPAIDWSKPERLVEYADPVYGTAVRRLTDAEGTRFDRNTYSRRQAENADGTLFMTYHGSAKYHIYDRQNADLVRALGIHPDAEPQWHPSNSRLIRHIVGPNSSVGSLTLLETSVDTGESTVIADLTVRLQDLWADALYMKDRAEGSPSMDGDSYAWIVYNSAEEPIGIVSYSLATDTILGTAPIRTDAGRLDWVSASVTGEYVVAGYGQGTVAYRADMTNPRFINRKADHSDLALDKRGRDAYVYVDFGGTSPDAGWIVSVDMETLERTRLVRLYGGANTSVHISGKGYHKPGWVVVSTYNCKDPGAWSCEKVFALELTEDSRLLNLAHTYNAGTNYWTETHAVVNRDFTRVYFNSDGGSGGIDAEVYELTLPMFGHDTDPTGFPGDANNDGIVDARDLNIIGRNWQLDDCATWGDGDFTADGVVDTADLNILGLNWLKSVLSPQFHDAHRPSARPPRAPLRPS